MTGVKTFSVLIYIYMTLEIVTTTSDIVYMPDFFRRRRQLIMSYRNASFIIMLLLMRLGFYSVPSLENSYAELLLMFTIYKGRMQQMTRSPNTV